MKNDLARFVLSALTLVIGAALEDMLPHFLSVGFPILITAVAVVALRADFPALIVFTIAAAAFEDGLSGLPVMTSAWFLLGVAALVRYTRWGITVLLVTCPLYQLWITIWAPSIAVPVLVRMFAALPMGLIASFIAGRFLIYVEGKVAIE